MFCDVEYEIVVGVAFEVSEQGTCETTEQLEEEHNENDIVDLIFNQACFSKGLATVHHQGCILSRINNYSNHPISVLELASSKHHVLLIDMLVSLNLPQSQRVLSLKLLDLSSGINTLNHPLELAEVRHYFRLVI